MGGSNGMMQGLADTAKPQTATPQKRATKSSTVYQDLKRKILTGGLTADSPITEQALAQEYECSQSTIREALMLLQEYGLVVRKGYQGTFVTNPTPVEAALLLTIRIDLETAGVMQSVERIQASEIATLRQLGTEFEACRARRDVFGAAEIDRQLHTKLFEHAGLPVLEPILTRTIMQLQQIMLPRPRGESAWTTPMVTPHDAIFDALEDGDKTGAVAAVRSHILSSAVRLAPHVYGENMATLGRNLDQGSADAPSLVRSAG
ncbi:GntR family transcriptional regulator [Roseibium denhamense]|uniref:Transcriptional regulator, GntR family n=1 Tax=Roseibium denhamense TaxID=76305 RepID=A0ABY1P7W8_9HYPH|nr:GntR family transcriptional regulator [Roseibium denhamense]SMP26997.1 transcriptional regulator, GntR family [Roseibium denhamense]